MNNQVFSIAVCDDFKMNTEEIAKLTEDICKEEQICPQDFLLSKCGKAFQHTTVVKVVTPQAEKENDSEDTTEK